MSTFLKTALMATLALSASVALTESKLVRAENAPFANGSDTPQVETPVFSDVHAPKSSYLRYLAEPLQTNFDPEPNDPPTRTGGSGTR